MASRTTAAKDALREEIKALRSVGSLMANVCYNLAQRGDQNHPENKLLADLARSWDAIKRSEQ